MKTVGKAISAIAFGALVGNEFGPTQWQFWALIITASIWVNFERWEMYDDVRWNKS